MHSSHLHLVVNGELYDHEAIRSSLVAKGYTFRGGSDSEIVLALYAEYGQDFPSHLRGEFSVVLYDGKRRLVVAARDRYGVKPLYWAFTPSRDRLLIAAEIKAFVPLGWKPEWDVRSILDAGWCYDDRTLFKGVKKVRPGHLLVAWLDGSYDIKPYWRVDFPDKRARDARSLEEMVQGVKDRLVDSVAVRMRADVPVGVYLSGGIDSSVIAGIATDLVKRRGTQMGSEPTLAIKCFSIEFEEPQGGKHDEAPVARRSADFLGVDFRAIKVCEGDLVEHFEAAVWHAEHLMPDLNFVAKYLLSDFARAEGYKVVLTGEGADETFAGYSLFCPDFLREPDTTSTFGMTEAERQRQIQRLEKEGDGTVGGTFSGQALEFPDKDKVMKWINGLSYPDLQASGSIWDAGSFASWTSDSLGFSNPIVTMADDLDPLVREAFRTKWHPLHSALYLAAKGPLPSMLLASLGDRSEMAHGLEARTPFLDHRLTEYVNGLPPSAKITVDEEGVLVEKYVLREAAKPFVTPELYVRKKHAFSSPFKYPIGGKVHTMLTRHLNARDVGRLGFVDWEHVQALLRMAFEGEQTVTTAFRQLLVLAELVVLGKAFGVPKATPWAAL